MKSHVLFGIVLVFYIQSCPASLKFEKILHRKLLGDYNKDVRPELGHKTPVEVHLDMRIKKLIKLDVKEQIFKVNSFTMLRWKDPQLIWNASDYKGIDSIIMGSDLIWTPDIVLYNNADEESLSHIDYYKTKATIYNTGLVIWTPPVTWSVSCSFDVTWFPVDKQACNLTFGSWTYPKSKLKLAFWTTQKETFMHEHFSVSGGEWKILEMNMFSQNISFSCCPEEFSIISYEFEMSRLSAYYFIYIILPLVSLAFLFLMVYFIPYASGERMGFGVTVLLSITVYLLVISESLPEKSDDKSMLGICFIIEFYLLCAALAMSLVTTNMSRRTYKPPGSIVKFRHLLCMCFRTSTAKGMNTEMLPLEPNGYLHCRNNENSTPQETSTPVIRRANEENEHNKHWNEIARFFDRFFFYFFMALLILIPVIVTSSLDHSSLGGVLG